MLVRSAVAPLRTDRAMENKSRARRPLDCHGDFRRSGLTVELGEGKLKRAMEIANKLGARYTLIIGDNEIAAGRYALKNMSTGEQLELTQDEIAAKLAAA